MLNFRNITPADRSLIHPVLYRAEGHGSEYSFANLFLWGEQFVADFGGAPLFFSRFGSWSSYFFPHCAPLRAAIDALRDDARRRGIRLRLFGVLPEEAAALERLFPGGFTFQAARNSFDYVYEIDRLAELHGKKLQAKRNHCNHFEKTWPDYRVLPLTDELLPCCAEFAEKWYSLHTQEHPDVDFTGERIALDKALRNFHALHMEGILLQTEEGTVAFSMGNRIRADVFDVNFEKALSSVNGAYAVVNREFAVLIRAAYPEVRFLNREDDMGLVGLRRAKESYFPDILLEKLVAEAVE